MVTAAERPAYTFDAIPLELRARRQWCAHRLEVAEPGKKPNRVPYDPRTGKHASSTDPTTWRTFEEAQAAVASGKYASIGFAFDADDPYVGLDLDNCRNPETGELAAWAQEIVSEIRSYSEASPSGTGVRIFARATLPEDGRHKGDAEIYFARKFLSVTGNHLEGTPQMIERRPGEVLAVYNRVFGTPEPERPRQTTQPANLADIDVLEHATKGKYGAEFAQLFAGDTSAYGGDESAADFHLCRHLAFWTGADRGQMNRLFSQSGLYRKKWDRASYREPTLTKAIAATPRVYEPARRPLPSPPEPQKNQDRNLISSDGDGVQLPAVWRRALLELVTSGMSAPAIVARIFLVLRKEAMGPSDLEGEPDDDGDGGPTYKRLARILHMRPGQAKEAIHEQDLDHIEGSPIRIEKRRNAGALLPVKMQRLDPDGTLVTRFPVHVIHVDGPSIEAVRFVPKCQRDRPKWGGKRDGAGRKPKDCPDNPEHPVVEITTKIEVRRTFCLADGQAIGKPEVSRLETRREYLKGNQDDLLSTNRRSTRLNRPTEAGEAEKNQDRNLILDEPKLRAERTALRTRWEA